MRGVLTFSGLLAAVVAAPFFAGAYYTTLLITVFAYSIALLGLNLLFGYGGLLSLGHAMFMALGAYSVALLSSKASIRSFELHLLIAIVTSGMIAAVLGLLCARYTTIYFSMLTLAFGMIFHSFLFKFYNLTGGETGISVARPTLLGIPIVGISKTAFLTGPFYWYSLVVFLISFAVMVLIVKSPFGLALRATRDNARKAEFLGVDVLHTRHLAFVVSAVYCAIGGAILAVSIGAADPELAFWTQSGNIVFILVLGGLGRLFGPVAGALTFALLQDVLMANTQYWRFGFGALLALIIILAPEGLVGVFRRNAEARRQ